MLPPCVQIEVVKGKILDFQCSPMQLHALKAYRQRCESLLPALGKLTSRVDEVRAWARGRVECARAAAGSSSGALGAHGVAPVSSPDTGPLAEELERLVDEVSRAMEDHVLLTRGVKLSPTPSSSGQMGAGVEGSAAKGILSSVLDLEMLNQAQGFLRGAPPQQVLNALTEVSVK